MQENLEIENYTALVDKGYHNGRQLQECIDAKITTIVAAPELVNSNEKGTTKAYRITKFIYHKDTDTYTCPQGETLTTTGTWHKKKESETVISSKNTARRNAKIALSETCVPREHQEEEKLTEVSLPTQ